MLLGTGAGEPCLGLVEEGGVMVWDPILGASFEAKATNSVANSSNPTRKACFKKKHIRFVSIRADMKNSHEQAPLRPIFKTSLTSKNMERTSKNHVLKPIVQKEDGQTNAKKK